MSRRDLSGARAILTGASSGIGRALAIEMARAGVSQVIVARRTDRLAGLAGQIASLGGKVETVVGDVTDPDVRRRAVDVAKERFGGLDILVNNAGVGATGRFDQSDEPRLRRVFEVNFFALAEMTRLALPELKRGVRPLLVNVGSILGHRGTPWNSEYCASKFAVHALSESIRAELAAEGVDVLIVSPGTTETEFFATEMMKPTDTKWPTHAPVSAEYVARRTVAAMRRGRHEIIPFALGRVMVYLNRLSPRFIDWVMARYARRTPPA
jgi:short-subunit dehydrogenase